MTMQRKDGSTRQKILETSLTMFARRGYSAVSIRDICKEVGVKESTIYYHFENKKDIFQALLVEVEQITEQMRAAFDQAFGLIDSVEEEPFVRVAAGFLEHYLLEPRVNRFIRMLAMENQVNDEAARQYRHLLFTAPLEQQEKVFGLMMEKGFFVQEDAAYLANEYYAIIYFIFQKYFSAQERSRWDIPAARQELDVHIRRFYRTYHNGEGEEA